MRTVDPATLRASTVRELERLGAPAPGRRHPLTWTPGAQIALRPVAELEARIAVLHVGLARALGMPAERAMEWLLDAHILRHVEPEEWRFIVHGDGDPGEYLARGEALIALGWLLGLVDHLDPRAPAGTGLGAKLPDLRGGEKYSRWQSRLLPAVHEPAEAAALLDLYSCLDWSCRQRPGAFPPELVAQRKWALEWALLFR